jgi:hypothetical protein
MSLIKKIALFFLFLVEIECYGRDLFRVEDIYVNEETGDYIDSKSIAIINGSKEALKKLICRLNASSDNGQNNLSCVNDIKFPEKLIKDYEIVSERITSKSYSANINFIFNREDIEAVMNRCGFKHSSTSPGATLLIPVIKDKNTYRIVDKESQDSEIRHAIGSISSKIGILDLETVYNSTIADISNLNLTILVSGTYDEILEILKKYGKTSLMLISINELTEGSISLYMRFVSKEEEYSDSRQYFRNAGEKRQQLMTRAFKTFIKDMDLNWKRGFTSNSEVVYNSGVTVELSDPYQWGQLNNILRKISGIKQYKFKAITNDLIEIDMKYTVSPTDLSKELLKYNVGIFKRGETTIMKFIK